MGSNHQSSQGHAESTDANAGTPLRLGIIGFGRLAHNYYVPAFRRLSQGQVVAIADPLPVRQAAARACFPHSRVYQTYQDLFAQEQLQGILVASPPSTHLAIWNDACQLHLPVFMEKPFVLPGELKRVIYPKTTQQLMMVNFNRRFWPVYQQLAQSVRHECIGKVQAAEFMLTINAQAWGAVTPYRLSAQEGGVLYDLGSHVFDLIWTLLGEAPVWITAERSRQQGGVYSMQLRLDFASAVTVHATLAYQKWPRERVMVYGSQGRLQLPNPNMTLHLIRQPSLRQRLLAFCRDGMMLGYRALRRDHSLLRYTIRAAIASFIASLRQNESFCPGFADAVQNSLWLEAAFQSFMERRAVAVAATVPSLLCSESRQTVCEGGPHA
jgi:predicted dehydrogenase